MLIDFLVLNLTNIYLATILLLIFKLNDKRLYLLLTFDLILHGLPIITIIMIFFYIIKQIIFKCLNETFITKYLLIIIYYFIFGILIYGIYNGISSFIFHILWQNLIINMIILFLGLKYLSSHKLN